MAEENCGRCGHPNLAGAKYCSRCTAALDVKCPDCSHLNAHGSKFCSQCAASLSGVRHTEPPIGPRRWLAIGAWSIVILGFTAFMLRSVFGTGSVEGEVRSRG